MITTIHAILISWLWCSFSPITWLSEKIQSDFVIVQLIIDHIQCPKCVGFWLALAMTGNIYFAITSAICTLLLVKMTSRM
jgi:hypothetical protein